MSVRRIAVLFLKDLKYGSRNFIFVFAIVLPLTLSLLIGLIFGTLLSDKPRLGIVDAGASQLAADLRSLDYINVQSYPSQAELIAALETGASEVGFVLPADFDTQLQSGEPSDLTIYIWGQSLVKNRAIASAALTETIGQLTGHETPVTVNVVPVGERASQSWQARLLPLIVLMAVMIGGIMVPATLMVEERRARTLAAVTTTPMTFAEVFFTKGLMGVILSVFSGAAILTLNGGWGSSPLLLFVVLALGGILSAAFGVLLGSRVKDLQTLFAVIKGMGILLYAPALIALFPDAIPQWLARFFPTYYIIHPVLEISQKDAGFSDVALDLLILAVLIAALVVALRFTAERLRVKAV